MRKLIVTLFALIGLGATGLAFAVGDGPDGLGIIGSPHDFSDNFCYATASYAPGDLATAKTYSTVCDETGVGTGWNDSGQICKVCHAPHNPATPNAISDLLWNHDDAAATFSSMYDSASMEDAAPAAPTGLALACLGCHDGVQGIDIFGTHTGATEVLNSSGIYASAADELTWGILTGSAINASTDHPVSVAYRDDTNDASYAGTQMWDRTALRMDNGVSIEKRLQIDGANFLVQCHSCHDVHNNSTASQWLLRLPVLDDPGTGGANEASELCLACHDK